jgi:predicted TIM-barrel fold metal-dependent hydrolase
MLVDWHMHVWLPEHLGPEWGPELDRVADPANPASQGGSFDAADAARAEAGLDAAVIIGLTSKLLRFGIPNEFIAEYVARDPDRTVGFASVDPTQDDAIEQLRYAAETLGLRGLKLSPPYQGFHPHSPEAWKVYEVASELGLVLMFHQGGVFSRRGTLEYAYPALLDKVAREFPSTRMIIAHAGQPWIQETVAVMYKNPNVFTDLSARFHRPWQVHNILLMVNDYGLADRVLFGSDFPSLTPKACIDLFRNMNTRTGGYLPPIDEQVIESIIHERPLSLLALDT